MSAVLCRTIGDLTVTLCPCRSQLYQITGRNCVVFLEDVKVIYEKKLTQRFVWLKKPCQYKETIQISGPVV